MEVEPSFKVSLTGEALRLIPRDVTLGGIVIGSGIFGVGKGAIG